VRLAVRPLTVGAALVALLGIGAIAVIARSTAERAPRVAPAPESATLPPPVAAAPAVIPAPPAPPGPDLAALRQAIAKPPEPGRPVVYGAPAPKPPEGSWEAVALAPRAAALGPVGAALGRELNELQPKLSACFDEDTQARHGRDGFTEVKDLAPMDDNGATVLVLQVEERPGELRVVDAPVETRGNASDGLIACAQRVLRGRVVPVPQAQGSARHRVLYTLTQ
jgi:hypothetical protein